MMKKYFNRPLLTCLLLVLVAGCWNGTTHADASREASVTVTQSEADDAGTGAFESRLISAELRHLSAYHSYHSRRAAATSGDGGASASEEGSPQK